MANLIDVFTIGFNSDGIKDFETELKRTETELSKAEKKVKDLEKSLEELKKDGKEDSDEFKKLSAQLQEAKTDVNNFSNSLKTMQGKSQFQLAKMRRDIFAVARGLAKLAAVTIAVRKSMQFYAEAEQLDFLAQRADVAVESIQKLGNAASRYGGSMSDTASTVGQFRTQDFKENAVKYGITIGATPEQTLENIAAKMERLRTDAEKIDLANSLGLDDGTTRLLIQGVARYREELKRADKYRLYTKEDIARMKDYQQIQQDIRLNIQSIEGAIARLLLPVIIKVGQVIRAISDWLREHEGAVKLIAIAAGLAIAISSVTLAVKLLSGALALLLANPVVAIIAGVISMIMLLIAVQQDYLTFLQGGDSIIGRILEHFGVNVEQARQSVINALKGIISWVQNTIQWFINLGGKVAEVAKLIAAVLSNLPAVFKAVGQAINPFSHFSIAYQKARAEVGAANNNPLNSVPQGAISNYYNAQSINNNNTANTDSVIYNSNKNATNKGMQVGTINIQTQATDGGQLAKELSAIMETDNGFLVQ